MRLWAWGGASVDGVRCGRGRARGDRGQADGGVDAVLVRDGPTTWVQAKHCRRDQVGVQLIRELYGVQRAVHVQHAMLSSRGSGSQMQAPPHRLRRVFRRSHQGHYGTRARHHSSVQMASYAMTFPERATSPAPRFGLEGTDTSPAVKRARTPHPGCYPPGFPAGQSSPARGRAACPRPPVTITGPLTGKNTRQRKAEVSPHH